MQHPSVHICGSMIILMLIGGTCQPSNPGNPDTGLTPRNWPQMNADAANTGFNPVHTSPFSDISRNWSVPVGPAPTASPICAPNGNIYIGNSLVTLHGVSRMGNRVLSRGFPGEIMRSTLAVDGEGAIYAVLIGTEGDPKNPPSRLVRLNQFGDVIAQAQVPATLASPKVLGDRVYLATPFPAELIVFNKNLQVVARSSLDCGLDVVGCAPNPILGIGCFLQGPGCWFKLDPLPSSQQPRLPSVAVTNSPTLTNPDEPLIVACAYPCLLCYRLVGGGSLQFVWRFVLDEDRCDDNTPSFTSPVITPGGDVILGYSTGRLAAFSVLDGRRRWAIELPAVTGTPTVGLRQIYVSTIGPRVYEIDDDGQVLAQHALDSAGNSAVALTLDNAFVAARDGLYSFSLNLSGQGKVLFETSPYSDPAIDASGTLYLLALDGSLQAFGGEKSTAFIARPQVSWQTPFDGGTLTYRPGQALTVSLAGAGGVPFSGRVSIESSPDGTLCESQVNGASATCLTSKELSLGTHTFTAYVTDENGVIGSAAITANVASGAPQVTLIAPVEGQTVFNDESISFSTAVTDPEEPVFPSGHVRWVSQISGEIGAGLSFQRTLEAGNHTITVTATDEKGVIGQAAANIQVRSKSGPVISISSPANDDVFSNTATISFAAQVTDLDQASFTPDSIQWRSNLDGNIGQGLSFMRGPGTTPGLLSLGTHTIVATATDETGVSGSDSVTIIVTQGPIVSITEPLAGFETNEITDIVFKASVSDSSEPNFPASGIKWTSNLDGELGTGPTITTLLSIGDHLITVTATDSHGLTGTAVFFIHIFAS